MSYEIRIPRLGWSMEEGTFIGWLKQPGEQVAVGEAFWELEGEKALQQIEAVDAGILYVPADAPAPGTILPVGALLGYLLAPGESVPGSLSPASTESSPAVIETSPQQTAKTFASRETNPLRDASSHAAVASPRAKRVATELGVNWSLLPGTGDGGRIREADVRAAGAELARLAAIVDPRAAITPRRKIIADRLRHSRDRTLPVTLTTTANATNLVALRKQYKSQNEHVPAYTDIVAWVIARVLPRHPQMAVHWSADQNSLVPVSADQFHIGIAVDTPDGLLVPVLRNIAGKSPITIAKESTALIDRARTGRLTAEEMQSGVITITNLGGFGIDAFTPIINYPEISILGLGAIRREPVVLPYDRIVPQDRITLSLTFDHAAVDGAPVAAFLQDIAVSLSTATVELLR